MRDPATISLRWLQTFKEVYESQNFSVVARREGISASQVSRVIHQLEDALGQQLFTATRGQLFPRKVVTFYPLCPPDARQP